MTREAQCVACWKKEGHGTNEQNVLVDDDKNKKLIPIRCCAE